MAASGSAVAAESLQLKVYTADANSFGVNSTLVYGATEAMVIDAGFTRADALRIAANVLDSGKQLKNHCGRPGLLLRCGEARSS